jgi:hypothetical protein
VSANVIECKLYRRPIIFLGRKNAIWVYVWRNLQPKNDWKARMRTNANIAVRRETKRFVWWWVWFSYKYMVLSMKQNEMLSLTWRMLLSNKIWIFCRNNSDLYYRFAKRQRKIRKSRLQALLSLSPASNDIYSIRRPPYSPSIWNDSNRFVLLPPKVLIVICDSVIM